MTCHYVCITGDGVKERQRLLLIDAENSIQWVISLLFYASSNDSPTPHLFIQSVF